MSLHGYRVSLDISARDEPFYALLMALMRKADYSNRGKLKAAWPEIYKELVEREYAPGGILPEEEGA